MEWEQVRNAMCLDWVLVGPILEERVMQRIGRSGLVGCDSTEAGLWLAGGRTMLASFHSNFQDIGWMCV